MFRKMLAGSLLLLFCVFGAIAFAAPPKNVILCIGDGMGFAQVEAAGLYAHGLAGTLSFERFENAGQMTTHAADSNVTDSAAGATAIATGRKVNNGVISVALPGNGEPLETLLEYFKKRGKSTGLVTTTYITHATPAAFGAHQPDRYKNPEIANDYFTLTRPNVLMGGGGNGASITSAIKAGYEVVVNLMQLQEVKTERVKMLAGLFGKSHLPYEVDGLGELPHLSQMTEVALKILDNDSDGFFLMVEGGRIDHAGHDNELERCVGETIEFSKAVETAVAWARENRNTLIIVTADHETGGLAVVNGDRPGELPNVTWSTKGHTGVPVPIYAWGQNAEMVDGVMDNTDVFAIATADVPFTIKVSRVQLITMGIVAVILMALVVALRRDRSNTKG